MAHIKEDTDQPRGKMRDVRMGGEKCPLIDNPQPGCYCTFTGSQYVAETVHYCGGRFRDCEIYKKAVEKKLVFSLKN